MPPEWKLKEDQFQLKQLKQRAQIRIEQNRPEPIDWLLQVTIPKENEFQYKNPLEILSQVKDIEKVHGEVEIILKLETAPIYVRYWKAILILLSKNVQFENTRVKESVSLEIEQMLDQKSLSELENLRIQIHAKLENENVDFDYWEATLQALKVYEARAIVTEIYSFLDNQEVKKEQIVIKQRHIKEPFTKEMDTVLVGEVSMNSRHLKQLNLQEFNNYVNEKREAIKQEYEKYLLTAKDTKKTCLSVEEDLFFQEALEDLHFEEQILISQGLLDEKACLNLEQFELREPYFLVRVTHGFEWKGGLNKYNIKNPPKNVVFGYKFFLHYPDLLDKTKPPFFRLQEDPNPPLGYSEETEMIVFCAGPPYQDVAFRIVKQEWEHNHNYGYKSEFKDTGILHLWFNFTRKKYQK